MPGHRSWPQTLPNTTAASGLSDFGCRNHEPASSGNSKPMRSFTKPFCSRLGDSQSSSPNQIRIIRHDRAIGRHA